MQTVLKLFKLQMDNKNSFLKANNVKQRVVKIFLFTVFIIVCSIAVGLVLFNIFTFGFVFSAQLLGLFLLVSQLIAIAFAVGHVINNLYLSKDSELLMVLPATPNQIFISKILLIYIEEIIVNALIVLPVLFSLFVLFKFSFLYLLLIPVLVVILPVFPIVVASFLSVPVMKIMKFLKKHVAVNILVILSLVLLAIVLYMTLLSNFADNFMISTRRVETIARTNDAILEIGKKIVIYYQLALAMLDISKWYWILLFIVICAVTLFATILIIRPFYFKIAMSNLENSVKVLSKPKDYKSKGAFSSLLYKEVLTVFRSPGYIFQYFIFTLLMPFIVFIYDKLLLSLTVSQAGENMIAGSHVLVVAILAMLSNVISASTISREGGNFYISKIVPVSFYKQIAAKLVFNAIFTVSALIVTMFVSLIYLDPVQVIVGTIAIIFASIGHIAMSIESDIKKPNIHYYVNEEVSKMDKNTTFSIIMGLLIALAMGMIVIGMAFSEVSFVAWILILLFGLFFCIYRIYLLSLRIHSRYNRIEV